MKNIKNVLLAAGFLMLLGCARKGLVSEHYRPDFYKVPKLMNVTDFNRDPRFLVYGDIQTGWRVQEKFFLPRNFFTWKMFLFPFYEAYWLGNGILGGINFLRQQPDIGLKEQEIVRDAILAAAEQTEYDFIVQVGDIPRDGRRPKHWESFLKLNNTEEYLKTIPFLPVMGNHEEGNDSVYGAPNFDAIFDSERFYSVESENMQLIMVDSNYLLDQKDYFPKEYQEYLYKIWFYDADPERDSWLEAELKQFPGKKKILFMHHPLFSFGKHHPDWQNTSYGFKLETKRKELIELIHEHGVSLLVSGHEHYYELSKVVMPDQSEILQLITGGGGVPLRSIHSKRKINKYLKYYESQNLDIQLLEQEKSYSYLDISFENGQIVCQIFRIPGNGHEEPTLIKTIRL